MGIVPGFLAGCFRVIYRRYIFLHMGILFIMYFLIYFQISRIAVFQVIFMARVQRLLRHGEPSDLLRPNPRLAAGFLKNLLLCVPQGYGDLGYSDRFIHNIYLCCF